MQLNRLPGTGLRVSPLGLGTVKFGRNTGVKYPSAFDLPDDRAILNLLALAQDHGVNFLDTAPAYGTSETRLGKLLTDRHQWVIASKVGEFYDGSVSQYDFRPETVQQSIEDSLRRLKTDYLDIVLVHSNGEAEEHIVSQSFPALERAYQAGKIRAYGMSSKTVAGGMASLAEGHLVMATYNALHTEEQPVLDAALAQQKGVLVKKALCSGHLDQIDPDSETALQKALAFVFAHDAVTSVVLGTIDPAHLVHNICLITEICAAKKTGASV